MYQARGKVMDHLLSRAFDQVRVQGVLDQIWERVSDQVGGQVKRQVWDQLAPERQELYFKIYPKT